MKVLRGLAFYKPDHKPWTNTETRHINILCGTRATGNVDTDAIFVYDDDSGDDWHWSMVNWTEQRPKTLAKCTHIEYSIYLTREKLEELIYPKPQLLHQFRIKDYL